MIDAHGGDNGSFGRKANIVLTGFALIAGSFLVTEHLAHALYARSTPRFVPKPGAFRSTVNPD